MKLLATFRCGSSVIVRNDDSGCDVLINLELAGESSNVFSSPEPVCFNVIGNDNAEIMAKNFETAAAEIRRELARAKCMKVSLAPESPAETPACTGDCNCKSPAPGQCDKLASLHDLSSEISEFVGSHNGFPG